MPAQVLGGVVQEIAKAPLLTQLEFASRFTMAEQVALDMATDSYPDATVRATLRVIEKNLLRATGVDTKDPRTIIGTEFCVDILIAVGQLAAGNRTQRLADLLA